MTDKPLSDYWRVNKSQNRILEMVEVLRSLRRLANQHASIEDLLYMEKRLVKEAGGYERPGNRLPVIAVTPKPLLEATTFPLDGDSFDMLGGITLHECAHIKADSTWIHEHMVSELQHMVAQAGEEIVADKYFKTGKQSKYIAKARAMTAKPMSELKFSGDALLDALNAFTSIAIYQVPIPSGIPADSQEVLLILLKHLKDITDQKPSERAHTYFLIADEIAKSMLQDQMNQSIGQPRGQRLDGVHDDPMNRSARAARTRAQNKVNNKIEDTLEQHGSDILEQLDPMATCNKENSLSQEDFEAITEMLADEASDVTSMIDNALGQASEQRAEAQRVKGLAVVPRGDMTTTRGRSVVSREANEIKVHRIADEKLVKQLMWLRDIKTQRDTVIRRNLLSGKVDKRRLYKAPINGEIFRSKEVKSNEKRVIWLLMDGSSSMGSGIGHSLYNMCASASKVLDDCRIYTYADTCYHYIQGSIITRTDDKLGMKEIRPSGVTPSGDALVFISQLLNLHGGGTLLHFTDGGSNTGVPLSQALDTVDRLYKKVHLVNIMLNSQFGYTRTSNHIQNIVIHDPDEFATILKQELAKLWKLNM